MPGVRLGLNWDRTMRQAGAGTEMELKVAVIDGGWHCDSTESVLVTARQATIGFVESEI